MKKIAKVTGTILAVLLVAVAGLALYVSKALPHVGPPADIHVQITPGRIQRGAYLARYVAGCIVCHSQRDSTLYGNPLIGSTLGKGGELFGRREGFPGKIYASNLTPYHLGGWTDGELFRAITTGESKDGHALFPIMNYPAYGRLDQEDIFSIIAYIRTLPSIPNDVPPTKLDFPVNFIVNTIPARATLMKKPDSNNAIAYGKYLVTMASCVECHSKASRGTIIAGTEFGGGRELPSPGGTFYSSNITSDKETGIGNWTRELFIGKFRQYRDSGQVGKPLTPGQINSPMPWSSYGGMKESDLLAMFAYLKTVKPIYNKVKAFPTGRK